ncbi:MAG TPA: hypothetical protein VMJ10_32560 [Kofleriaceae bacterium]|nr:hypothetical protein [Kofleriaceae bacterium]
MSRGGKLLAVGAVAVLALVGVLWYQMQAGPATAAPSAKPQAATVAQPVAGPSPALRAIQAVPSAADESKNGKVAIASDEFMRRFMDIAPKQVSGPAMRKCYHGGLNRKTRDQLITIDFHETIKDGEVTMSNVTAKESSLNDPEMQACMLDAVAHAHWHDDSLPDYQGDDEVTITPERVNKKYNPRDYEGPEAPPNTPR